MTTSPLKKKEKGLCRCKMGWGCSSEAQYMLSMHKVLGIEMGDYPGLST
jgi:hypothetical protein